MSSNHVISIENLSKRYKIGRHSQTTLNETLRYYWKRWKTRKDAENQAESEFYALENISLTVSQGDRVAIIGSNGAGKSTLLKILARITVPTEGHATVQGRVASLLEVGTGFHPELTGRENIFLNGALMGMSTQEIKTKLDAIVDFSGVEKFLDTPVKRYSSGMYTRLGFSVAVHLDSEILIVDEVLSVGDLVFQEKCLKFMDYLGRSGRTILFVSHNIQSVLSICQKGFWLSQGKLKYSGPIQECVQAYLAGSLNSSLCWKGPAGDDQVQIYAATLSSSDRSRSPSDGIFYVGETIQVSFDYEVFYSHPSLVFCFEIWNRRHQMLASSHTCEDLNVLRHSQQPGCHRLSFMIETQTLRPDDYYIKIDSFIPHQKPIVVNSHITLSFSLWSSPNDPISPVPDYFKGGLFLGAKWQLEPLNLSQ